MCLAKLKAMLNYAITICHDECSNTTYAKYILAYKTRALFIMYNPIKIQGLTLFILVNEKIFLEYLHFC